MSLTETIKRKPSVGWWIFAAVMVIVFVLGLLAASITQRRAETANLFNNKRVDITGIESRNELWGENYPREYTTWKKTADTDFRSKHLGNVSDDMLAAHPKMVVLWAGYAFSKAYSSPRGHMHAIEDMRASLRTGTPDSVTKDMQPGTCWTCKSPDVPRVMHEIGIEAFYKTPWSKLGNQIVNPIGCADCHDPKTMNLTITRPALIEAFKATGRDIANATPQEMRSLVCAQCHVEYYFKGDGKYLTFPWSGTKDSLTVEAFERYYDNAKFADFINPISKTPIIKAQHPDYELFLMGPHGQHNVSCADCHMPYKVEGGIKYSDHQITSPLQNIAGSCQTCHRESEDQLRNYVYQYQDKALEVRDRVETELAKAHIMAKAAWDNGATETEMAPVLQLIRHAQWRWDFAVASHGASFHAPAEVLRILSHSLDLSYQAQIAVQKVLYAHNVKGDVPMPDLSTKEKAEAYLGQDIKTLDNKKAQWLETVVPKWIQAAKANKRLL